MSANQTTPDTTLTVRVNSQLKSAAQATFRDLGLDLSTAVNIFLRQVVHSRSLPFPVSLAPTTPVSTPVATTSTPYMPPPAQPAPISTPTPLPDPTPDEESSGAARLLESPDHTPLGEPFPIDRHHQSSS